MKKGFTLAEVLITLGVIGVISVLTLPNLITNYQTRVLTTQLQRVYNQVSNTVVTAMRDEVVSDYYQLPWYGQDTNKLIGFLESYFDVTNTCTPDSYNNCLGNNYTSYNGTVSMTPAQLIEEAKMERATPCAVLKSGATICTVNKNFLVDVNGPSNPNVLGKDVFWFMVRNDGKMITSVNDPARYLKSEPGYSALAATFDEARVKYRAEANGDKCFGREKSARYNGCLPYIMSHGWKLK